MPYIKQEIRKALRPKTEQPAMTAGELAFQLMWLCRCYQESLNGLDGEQESYQTYAEILGALETVKQEMYRFHIEPYEHKKWMENGGV